MANCIIQRNSDNQITAVKTAEGNHSQLFDILAGIPVISDINQAADAYMSVVGENFKARFGNWEAGIARNPEQVRSVSNRLQSLGIENQEAVLAAARTMDNPVLVSPVTRGEDYAINGRVYYSEELGDSVYLMDRSLSETVVNTDMPEGEIRSDFEVRSIQESTSPVVDYTDPDGNHFYVVDANQEMVDTANVEQTFNINGLTLPNGEPKPFFRTEDGVIHDSYESAIKGSSGRNIEVGFLSGSVQKTDFGEYSNAADILITGNNYTLNNPDSFIKIMDVDGSTNTQTTEGYINYLIKAGLLSGKKKRYDGKYYLVGAGNAPRYAMYNSVVAASEAQLALGSGRVVQYEDGRFEILEDNSNIYTLTTTDGRVVEVNKDSIKKDLKNGKFQQLKRQYQDMELIVLMSMLEDGGIYRQDNSQIYESAKKEDSKLRLKMMSILKSLGVSVIGMQDYIDRYYDRIGIEPGARALANIGQNIVALAEDSTEADITEETAHFIIETYANQDEIEEILPDVENTAEWADYSATYYGIYGKQYQGDELTRMVRREILGIKLRNEMMRRFQNTEDTVTGRLQTILNNFIQSIRNFFSSQRTELDTVISQIADLALSENEAAFNTTLLDTVEFTMYSASGIEIHNFFTNQLQRLEGQFRNLRKIDGAATGRLAADIEKTRRLQARLGDEYNDNLVKATITSIVSTLEAQINQVNRIISQSQRNKKDGQLTLSISDYQNVENINSTMLPLARELRDFINRNKAGLDKQFVSAETARMDAIMGRAGAMNATVEGVQREDNQGFLRMTFRKYGRMTEQELNNILKVLNNGIKDITKATNIFGTLQHSKNPILNVFQNLVSQNSFKSNWRSREQLKNFHTRLQQQGWTVDDFINILQKHGDGSISSFLMSEVDFAKYQDAFEEAQLLALQAAFPEQLGTRTIEQLKKWSKEKGVEVKVMPRRTADMNAAEEDNVDNNLEEQTVRFKADMYNARIGFMNNEQRQAYNASMNAWFKANNEQRYDERYDEFISGIYERAAALRPEGSTSTEPISQDAIDSYKALSRQRYQIKQRFLANGRVDWAAIRRDPNASAELNEINREKELSRSIYNEDGELKTGYELQLAHDMQAIDAAWSEFFASQAEHKKTVSSDFVSSLKTALEQDGPEGAYNFLIANSFFNFNDQFNEDLSDNIVDIARAAIADGRIDELGAQTIEEYLAEMDRYRSLIRTIVRRHRDMSSSGNIDFDSMSQDELDSIKEYQEEIAVYRKALTNELDNYEIDTEFSDIAEYEMNDAYEAAYKDSGLANETEFLLKHTTRDNETAIRRFRDKLVFKNGNRPNLNKYEVAFLQEVIQGFDDRTSQAEIWNYLASAGPEMRQQLVDRFARRRALPYFRRFAPAGFSQLMTELKTGQRNIVDFAQSMIKQTAGNEGVFRYLEMNVRDDWYEESSYFDQFRNLGYQERSDYGAFQPRKDLYRDERYNTHFGINAAGEATQNTNEFEMIQILKELKRQGLDSYKESSTAHNLYMIPQVSRGTFEKITSKGVSPTETLNNLMRDLTMNRTDELLYGQNADLSAAGAGNEFMTLPKYFIRAIEERTDVSNDLGWVYTAFVTQANLYDEKTSTINTALGLEQALLNTKFEGGKDPKATNTYSQFREHLNAHYYGVRINTKLQTQTRYGTVDVAKTAIQANKAKRTFSVGFSPIVAVTAFTTGQLNLLLEAAVGQYLNFKSLRFANKEVRKLTAGYVSEIGDIDRNNELYVFGESFGIFSLSERLRSAGFNKAVRVAGKNMPYKFIEILNFPLSPQVMFAVLDDTRFINGKFYRRNEFYEENSRLPQGERLTGAQVKRAWDLAQKDSLRNILKVTDGILTVRPDMDTQTVMDRLPVTQREITSLNQIADAVVPSEDKSSASRNFLWNFFLNHRGWLQINIQRRWKKAGYSFSNGQMEEGTYWTALHFIDRMKNYLKENNLADVFGAIKNTYHSLNSYEKRNLMRVAVDAGVLMIGMMAQKLFAGMGDDDESKENWLAQFTAYIGLRTVSEMYSQMPGFIEREVISAAEDPFAIARTLGNITDLSNYRFWEEVSSGPYKGESRTWALLAKETWLKNYYQISSAAAVRNTASYFKLNNRRTLFLVGDKDEGPSIYND